METARRVSEDGKLMAFSAKFYFRELPGLPKELMTNPFLLKGAVERGRLQPRIFFGDLEIKEFKLGAMDVPSQANDFHPMTLIGRLRGLRVGQTWKVTHFDYGQMLPKEIELLGGFVKKALATPDMIAQVTTATIEWPRKSNRQVECFLIELGERGKEAVYRTWVRRVDGSVLKFELPIMESKMHLVRISN
jgi:hypothetical protein